MNKYGMFITLNHKNWEMGMGKDFSGKKFDTFEEAEKFIREYTKNKGKIKYDNRYQNCSLGKAYVMEVKNYLEKNSETIRHEIKIKY